MHERAHSTPIGRYF